MVTRKKKAATVKKKPSKKNAKKKKVTTKPRKIRDIAEKNGQTGALKRLLNNTKKDFLKTELADKDYERLAEKLKKIDINTSDELDAARSFRDKAEEITKDNLKQLQRTLHNLGLADGPFSFDKEDKNETKVVSDPTWYWDPERKNNVRKGSKNEGVARPTKAVYGYSHNDANTEMAKEVDNMLLADAQHKMELLEEKIANKTREQLKVNRELFLLRTALDMAYKDILKKDGKDISIPLKENLDEVFEGKRY